MNGFCTKLKNSEFKAQKIPFPKLKRESEHDKSEGN